jgi:CspA family cold shock protein
MERNFGVTQAFFQLSGAPTVVAAAAPTDPDPLAIPEPDQIRAFLIDPSKGYGFLIRDNGGDLFVHLRSVKTEDRRKLRENTRVKFTVEETEKGPQAENIKII